MSKHTPGPWRFHRAGVSAGYGLHGTYICDLVTSPREYDDYYDSSKEGIRKANGALIAAAPDMLEALKVTRAKVASLGPDGACGPVYTRYQDWLSLINAAIAKAEGLS